MNYGCVARTRQVKGHDAAWCSAKEGTIAVAVADGFSIVDAEDRAVAISSSYASQKAISLFQQLYYCYEDYDCRRTIEAALGDPVVAFFVKSIEFNDVKGLAKLLGELTDKLKMRSEVKAMALTTLAGGIVSQDDGVVMVIGNSSIALIPCPKVEDLSRDLVSAIATVKEKSMIAPTLDESVSKLVLKLTIRKPVLPLARSKVTEAEVSVENPIRITLGPTTLHTLAQLFNGIVLVAWTDGIELHSSLIKLKVHSGRISFDADTLRAFIETAPNDLKPLLDELSKLVNHRPLIFMEMKAYQLLGLLACLVQDRDIVDNYVSRLLESRLASSGDDRSIAIAYTRFSRSV